jgi:hypothetical protein
MIASEGLFLAPVKIALDELGIRDERFAICGQ